MQRSKFFLIVERTSETFPINCHYSPKGLLQSRYPAGKKLFKFSRVEQRNDSAESIMRRYPIWQTQKLSKPCLSNFSKLCNAYKTIRPADYCTNCDDNNINQLMLLPPVINPRVFYL